MGNSSHRFFDLFAIGSSELPVGCPRRESKANSQSRSSAEVAGGITRLYANSDPRYRRASEAARIFKFRSREKMKACEKMKDRTQYCKDDGKYTNVFIAPIRLLLFQTALHQLEDRRARLKAHKAAGTPELPGRGLQEPRGFLPTDR